MLQLEGPNDALIILNLQSYLFSKIKIKLSAQSLNALIVSVKYYPYILMISTSYLIGSYLGA